MPTYRKPLVRINGQTKQALSTELLWVPGRLRLADRVSLAAADSLELDPLVYNSNMVWITSGSSTISYINTAESDISQNGEFLLLYFGAAVTLVNSDFLVCPGGANITAAVGDFCTLQNFGSARWKVSSYQRADGTPLVGGLDSTKLPLAGGTMTGPINQTRGSIAAAANMDLTASDYFNVTGGPVTITSFSSSERGARRVIEFSSSGNTLQNNTILILPGTTDIAAAEGDSAEFVFEGAGTWRCLWYQRKDGTALVSSASDSTKLPLAGGVMTGQIQGAPWMATTLVADMVLADYNSNCLNISGTSPSITSFGAAADGTQKWVRFASAGLTITYSTTRFALPGGNDIVTQAGDTALFINYGGGNFWRCVAYLRADGTPLVGAADNTKLPLAGGTMTGALNEAAFGSYNAGTNASADISQVAANSILLNGTGNITDFGTLASGAIRRIYFQQSCTLVHNSNLLLPGQANISVVNGDWAEVISMGGGVWVCSSFTRYSGMPVVSSSDSTKLPLAGGTMTGALNLAAEVTLASAATVAIGAAAANTVNITGTTAITAFDTIAAGARRVVVFGGALTLTHDATKLILPYAANITTVAGDTAEFESLGSGNWKCLWYTRSTTAAVKAALNLDQVNNTADTVKPVSTAQAAAIATKVSLTGAETIAGAKTFSDSMVVNADLTFSGQLNRQGSGVVSFLANRTNSASNSFYAAQTTAGTMYFGNTNGTTFTVNNASSASGGMFAVSDTEIVMGRSARVSLPFRVAQYTLSTLPSASAYSGYEIDVTDATGGAKRCRSNGTSWLILNTTTVVS